MASVLFVVSAEELQALVMEAVSMAARKANTENQTTPSTNVWFEPSRIAEEVARRLQSKGDA